MVGGFHRASASDAAEVSAASNELAACLPRLHRSVGSPGEHRTRLGWVSDDGGKDEDLNVMSCDVGVFAIGNDAG